MERRFAYDQVTIDSSKMEEYEHALFGPTTVFKDVVIAREIVHPYDDGMAYKPADELEGSYWTADGMWAIASGHPKEAIIMDRDQMQGKTMNVRFSKSLLDPKTRRPNNRGIVSDLHVFNKKVAPEILADMKSGKRHDVSIGFFFSKDETPGVIEEDGHPLKGMTYDYVQRRMAINHTAFALEAGRCPMPFCGLGADELTKQITGDPFGEYRDFKDCVAKNQDKDDPEAYCATIERKIKEARKKKNDALRDAVESMIGELRMVLSKFDVIEEDAGKPKTEAERAMAHFNISEEKWGEMSEEEKKKKIAELPPRGEGLKRDEGETIVDENMSDEDLSGLFEFYTLSQENWDMLEEDTRIVLKSLYAERQKVYEDTDPSTMVGDEEEECDDCDDAEEEQAEEEDQPDEPVEKKPFVPTKSVEDLLRRQP